MGVIIPSDEYQAVYRWSMTGDNEEMVTTLGLRIDFVGSTQERVDELYGQATAGGSLAGPDTLLSGWTFVGVTMYWQNPLEGIVVAEHIEPIVGGAGADVSLPNNCAFLVKKRTALAGPKNRGRFYLPPYHLSEGEVTRNGTLSSTLYADVQGRLNGWYANITANQCTPVVQHSDGSGSIPITSFVLQTRIATQRRRMRN